MKILMLMPALVGLAVPAAHSSADVLDAAATGFSIRAQVEVAGDRQRVWRAAIDEVGSWWSDDHSFSGNAANMRIDARTQGCFCEALGDSAGVVHMTVSFINPGVMLRLTGGLGPLGLMGVNGNMTWEFADAGEGTLLTLNYSVGGYYADGLDSVASAVDSVLSEQLQRLKSYVETGAPVR